VHISYNEDMSGASQASTGFPFIIELREVDKEFLIFREGNRKNEGEAGSPKRLQALSRVSLKIKPGEFVFLTGPSGAGKSTLLRLVLGLETPSIGEILTLGQSLAKMSESKRRALRRKIGIIFQDHRLLSSLNVFENIELPLCLDGIVSKKERHRRVSEILETVQLRDHSFESVNSLSAGEKQRVGVARALVTCPSLIIADEPTGNLDPANARSLIRMLRELKGHGTTVFIATHDIGLVRDFGGRVLELVGGAIPTLENNPISKAFKVPRFWTQSANP